MVKGAGEVFQELKQIDSKHQDKSSPRLHFLPVLFSANQCPCKQVLDTTIPTITRFGLWMRFHEAMLPHRHARLRVNVALLDRRLLLHLSFPGHSI